MIEKIFVFFGSAPFTAANAPSIAEGSTYTTMRVEKSVMRDTYTTYAVDIIWPGSAFWSFGHRYACVKIDDGSTPGGRLIACGEVVGFPIGLAGAEVTIEVVCRAPDHAARVSAALQPSRERLTKHLAPGDDFALLELALVSIYTDPITHEVFATPFGGLSDEARDFFGEGAAVGTEGALALSPIVIAEPAQTFTLEANARHVQQYTGAVRAPVPQFSSYKHRIGEGFSGGDADHVILGLNTVDYPDGSYTVTQRPAYADPQTCYVVPAVRQTLTKRTFAAADIRAAITARCTRDETALIEVRTNVGDAPGSRTDTTYPVTAAEMTGVNFFDQVFNISSPGVIRATRFRCTRPSAFLDGVAIAASSIDVVDGLVEIATRRALDHVYCVEIQIETTPRNAELLDSRHRARLRDVRLPGGSAVGWVVGVRISYGESDSAVVTVLCPLVSSAPVVSGSNVTSSIGVTGGTIEVFCELGAPAGYSPQKPGVIGAIEDGDGAFFMEWVRVINDATAQELTLRQIEGTNAQPPLLNLDPFASRYAIDDARDYIAETEIDVLWAQREIGEEVSDRARIGTVSIRIAEGIRF